jgi:hypothetical protein
LTGTNLFLAASISSAEDFANATEVPPDFTGGQLAVPHPSNGVLYLKLRDDPGTVQTLTLPVTLVAASSQSSGQTAAMQTPAGDGPASPPPDPAPPAKPEEQ